MTRTRWALAAAVLVAAACGVVLASDASGPTPAVDAPPSNTEMVEKGRLSAMVSGTGTLTYRARPDGSAYAVVNQADGVYTRLPEAGDGVGCGAVLYRVDNRPILLLCGAVPMYRALHAGLRGPDVRQLNHNLHRKGSAFTSRTEAALETLQRRRGLAVTGRLGTDQAVFLPEPIRIAKVAAEIGGPARPGAPVLSATSDELNVRVDLDAAQQNEVRKGARVQITLPGNRPVPGRVAGFGRIAQAQQGAAATIPTFIDLDDPARADGLDQAPVEVDITTRGVQDALSVPVTALVGRSGGGFAVEIARDGGRRELVAVKLGLFDTGGGRVQVEGDLRAGESVVVPST